jgi:uncharacterized protein YraI
MKKIIATIVIFMLTACSPSSTATLPSTAVQLTALPSDTPTPFPTSTSIFTPVPPTDAPTQMLTATAIPFVESLKASVTTDLLSCRYGPGPEYLYLFAFKKGANIKLIGRAEGNNWLLVENEPQKCWINSKFVEIMGDQQTLKSIYPDGFTLIVSPYYGPTTVLSAKRQGDKITISWVDVPVSPGKYEDENMFPYIIEVWRCENGEILFDPLVSRLPFITFVDQTDCNAPSHGRVYVQEKHGYAGPAEIPWPVP